MLSILITTYNSSKFLSYSVNSVLNQTYKDFELVIIDDGSTDDTESAIKSFRDERIRYIKIPHAGRSKALNYGLGKCSNDWVALMDADDIWDPEKLEKQISNFSFNFNSISCTWSAYFAEKKIKFTVDTPLNIIEIKEKLLLHSYICNPSVIYNRKFILGNGGYDENLSVFEDHELWLRLLNKIKFEVIPEYLVFMRYHKISLSYRGLQRHKDIVLSIQNKYFRIGKDICGISRSAENELIGWREYFFGRRKKARKCWNSRPTTMLNFRVLIAYIITYLPEKWIRTFKCFQLRYRVRLFISPHYSSLKKRFEHVVIENNGTLRQSTISFP